MIADMRLQYFRSYDDASFEFDKGVNIIVGPNASGKTNLLEAVLVLSKGASYRVADSDLVQFDKAWMRLDADMSDGGRRTIKLETEPRQQKTYIIDEKEYKRPSLQHRLPAILFEPNDLRLFSGGPERRRNYLDDLLEQTVVGYSTIRRQYKRTLAQRNSILKRHGGNLATQIFPWDVRLSQLAGRIVRERAELVERINQDITQLYVDLSKTETKVTTAYNCQWPPESYESSMLKKLTTNLDTDLMRGFTTTGPHREDLIVLYDGHLAAESASRGEVRTAVLALKILELQVVEQARSQTPILLLDDVFSELDGSRRHALTDYLKKYQTFITTTDADVVLNHFTDECRVLPLVRN